MSEFPFGEIDQGYAQARQELRAALSNSEYVQFATSEGPLELSEMENQEDDEVQSVVDRFGWPSLREDGIMESVYRFPNPEDFLDSLCPEDEYGRKHLSSAPFIRLLQCHPIMHISEAVRMDDAMGIAPVVHRAYVTAPAFFDPLRQVLNKLQDRYGVVSNKDNLYDELMRPANNDIVEAIYMAYQIMGRLLKVYDLSVAAEQHSYKDDEAHGRVILNADHALRSAEVA